MLPMSAGGEDGASETRQLPPSGLAVKGPPSKEARFHRLCLDIEVGVSSSTIPWVPM